MYELGLIVLKLLLDSFTQFNPDKTSLFPTQPNTLLTIAVVLYAFGLLDLTKFSQPNANPGQPTANPGPSPANESLAAVETVKKRVGPYFKGELFLFTN